LAGASAILLAGACIARADELSDLRANNLLLQQKIDQARAANGEAPEDAPASLQGSFPRSFRIPGTETSVRIGGNVTATVHDSLER
jgi:hypothetical protein